jgi:hypothetical protein
MNKPFNILQTCSTIFNVSTILAAVCGLRCGMHFLTLVNKFYLLGEFDLEIVERWPRNSLFVYRGQKVRV